MNLNYKAPKNSQEVAMNALEILKHSYSDPFDHARNPEQTELNALNYAKNRGLIVTSIEDLREFACGKKKCKIFEKQLGAGRPFSTNPKNKITSVRMTEEDFGSLVEKFGSVQLALEYFLQVIKNDEIKKLNS